MTGDTETDAGGGLSDAAIAELKSRFPGSDLMKVKAPDGSPVVLRTPDKAIYSAFMADVTNDKKDKAASMTAYALRCVAYPNATLASELFSRYPAYPGALASKLNEMAGSVDDLEAKKL